MRGSSHPKGGLTRSGAAPGSAGPVCLRMLVLLAALLASSGCRRSEGPPSILLLVVDTLRADHVGAVRSPADVSSPTPEIDRWSRGAAVFRHATTPAPFTMPAMAAVMTGVYPDRCGVVAHEPGVSLASWRGATLAEAARNGGMATAAVIANPWLARKGTGFDRGFDEFKRLYDAGAAAGTSGASAVTDEAIRILERLGDRRFLLWAHYFDPHMPYAPPPAFARAAGAWSLSSRVMDDFNSSGRDLHRLYRADGYSTEEVDDARRLYEGEVRFADHEIGRLLERLGTLGRARETIVIIASDHGESLGEHGLFFAHDYTLYEELTRVAWMMRGPGVAEGVRDEEVSLIDVLPTLCRLAALDCGGEHDGRDVFTSGVPGRTLFAAGTPLRAKGTPFDRLQVPGLHGRWTMALGDSHKLVRIPSSTGTVFEMYDLAADRGERSNVAARSNDQRRKLEVELDAWTRAMDEARPPPAAHAHRRRQDTKTLRSLGYLQ